MSSAPPLVSACYFGTVEFYRALAPHPLVTVDTGEHYQRQSYRTRTTIVGPNGKQDLVVPIERRSGERMSMHRVGLSYVETWPQQQLHAIRSAYGRSPWFIHFIDDLDALLLQRYSRLVDLDLATMRLALRWLGASTVLQERTSYVEAKETTDFAFDLRDSYHPKKPLPPELPKPMPYPQVFADRQGFQERLSIIDLLCNAGPDARRYIRGSHI